MQPVTEDQNWLRATFDGAALLYDRVRPGYPEELFDDVVARTGLPRGGRVLEIGCGTGQATVPLARRGYCVLCVELGENLAAVARRNLASYPRQRCSPRTSRSGRRRRKPSTSRSRRRPSTGSTLASLTPRSQIGRASCRERV